VFARINCSYGGRRGLSPAPKAAVDHGGFFIPRPAVIEILHSNQPHPLLLSFFSHEDRGIVSTVPSGERFASRFIDG
jgi:hypothetical protein